MAKKQIDLGLTGLDELFMDDQERAESRLPKIHEIPLSEIDEFPNHPFHVRLDEDMDQLVESIKERGIITPVTLRQKPDGRYEIVSGHRRTKACELAGLTTVKAEIKELSRDEAIILMVESNLQRTTILPSEKAYAYKLKMEALSHQGIACGQVGHKSRDDISDTDSGRQVQRYIRLTHLIPELLEKMDKEEIAFSVGVELSYLDEYSQRDVLEQCEINDCTPSYSQAWRMHKADREGLLTKDVIQFLMSEEKPNQRETVKIPTEKLREFAPDANPQQLEDFVLKACEHYRKYLIRQRGREER